MGRMGSGRRLGPAAARCDVALEPEQLDTCCRLLDQPQPRVALGLALRGIASSALDISDGLMGDLGHILERSGVGAEIYFDALPAHPALEPLLAETWAQQCVLAGGDDYELLFTVRPSQRGRLRHVRRALGDLPITRIGVVTKERVLLLKSKDGNTRELPRGYEHFR